MKKLWAIVWMAVGSGCAPEGHEPRDQALVAAPHPPRAAAPSAVVREPQKPPSILVSKRGYDSADPFDLLWSNHTVVNRLLEEGYDESQIPRPALWSSVLVFYDREIQNGGFPQLLYNSRAKPALIALLREALGVIGGREHQAHFAAAYRSVAPLPGDPERGDDAKRKERLQAFIDGSLDDYASNHLVKELRASFEGYRELPDLTKLNAEYLRAQPGLRPLPMPDLIQRVEQLVGHPIAEGDEARAAAKTPSEPKVAPAAADTQ